MFCFFVYQNWKLLRDSLHNQNTFLVNVTVHRQNGQIMGSRSWLLPLVFFMFYHKRSLCLHLDLGVINIKKLMGLWKQSTEAAPLITLGWIWASGVWKWVQKHKHTAISSLSEPKHCFLLCNAFLSRATEKYRHFPFLLLKVPCKYWLNLSWFVVACGMSHTVCIKSYTSLDDDRHLVSYFSAKIHILVCQTIFNPGLFLDNDLKAFVLNYSCPIVYLPLWWSLISCDDCVMNTVYITLLLVWTCIFIDLLFRK